MVNRFNIFEKYPIENNIEFEMLLSTIEKEQSLFYLIESVKYANNCGVFSMEETELISKCIRKLHEPPKTIIETDENKKGTN